MNWQPIETAPRDGTNVLLYEYGTVALGKWCRSMSGTMAWRPYTFNGNTYSAANIKHVPTHWMELPDPPADTPRTVDEQINSKLKEMRAQKEN